MMKNSLARFTPSKILSALWPRIQTVCQGVLSIPTKLWYANSVSLAYNFAPRRKLRRLRRDFSSQDKQLIERYHLSAAELLQHSGYFLLPASHSRTFLVSIQNRIAQYIENSASFINNPSKASRFLIDPLDKIPELIMFMSDDICRIIAAYYGCAFRINHLQVWRNYHVKDIDPNRTDQFSNTFHHDNFPVTGLRVFVLLCDGVTRETGAFRFHDKNTSKYIIRRMGYFHRNMLTKSMLRRLTDPATLKFFEGNLGDVCIVNTQECLHAASVPKLGSFRDMLEFEVYPTEGSLRMGQELFENLPADYQSLVFYTNRYNKRI